MQLSLILGVMTLGFADDPAAQGLLKELEGTYKVASMEANGVATPAEFLDLIQKVVIKDGVMSFHEGKDGKAAASDGSADGCRRAQGDAITSTSRYCSN